MRDAIVFIGVAQEKAQAFNGKKVNGQFQFDRDKTVSINLYMEDEDSARCSSRSAVTHPGVKLCLNGHEWAKRQLDNQRGIVCMTADAFGHEGLWSDRPGFDQNGQVASGFAVKEGGAGPPKFSPVFYLADLMTGYFAASVDRRRTGEMPRWGDIIRARSHASFKQNFRHHALILMIQEMAMKD